MGLSIEQFFTELDRHPESIPIGDLVTLMKQLDITPDDLSEFLLFTDECYQRNLWRCGTGYAAIVMCWSAGQCSPIHDHKGSACGVRVLQGQCTETIFLPDDEGTLREHGINVYDEGLVCGSYDTDIHIIGNRHPEGVPLVTLHIYTPPLQGYRVYEADGTFEVCADSTLEQQREMLAASS